MNLKLSKMKTPILTLLTFLLLFAACEKDPFEASSGTFTDERDGREYKWVKIGDQIWMAENLAYVPYVCAPDSQCGIWIYGYNGEGSYGTNYHTYGALYDWETAMEVCPEGWHLPSDEEWMELERYLGMKEKEIDLWACRGSDVNIGGKLAATGNNYWSESFVKTNETGFTALPGGERNIWNVEDMFHFKSINSISTFWTSSDFDEKHAINRTIVNGDCIDRMIEFKNAGFSIRCIKN